MGAHLDSVAEGPGINDNGSGTAGILEIALHMKKLNIKLTNHLRFAFWGAEEARLHGSTYYVNQLSTRQQRDIAVNLNLDMIGSPNYGRFVYDGDGSAFGTPGRADRAPSRTSFWTTSPRRGSRPSRQSSMDAPTTRRS